MSRPDQEEGSPVSAELTTVPETTNNTSNNLRQSWASSLLTLFSGSRTDQDHVKSLDQKLDEELTCPICQDIMDQACGTSCGHSFCYHCITVHIADRRFCPVCRTSISGREIYHNYQLKKLIEYRNERVKNPPPAHTSPPEEANDDDNIDYADLANSFVSILPTEDLIKIMEKTIAERKYTDFLETKAKKELLELFLSKMKDKNDTVVRELVLQNQNIQIDLDAITSQVEQDEQALRPRKRKHQDSEEDEVHGPGEEEEKADEKSLLSTFSSRMEKHFDNIKDIYLKTMNSEIHTMEKRRKLLSDFSSTVLQLTQYDGFHVVDTVDYSHKASGSQIVSAIEFDQDAAFFAVAGVTKEIKIFDFSLMGNERYANKVDHCPVRIMHCGHKVSCLAWSPYFKSQIVSSDYEGSVEVWDTSTGQTTHLFREHKRRAWSVDISQLNPSMIASGSDDNTVKIWSLHSQKSVHTLKFSGSVCCAKFAPDNSSYIAVGGADHAISCYDLRFSSSPVKVYKGHTKAVSYVKWLNKDELVSASTDSTLRLWDKESAECNRVYKGHRNETNFVGLSVNDDWISCGSEDNTIYTYHKSSSIPVTTYTFPTDDLDDSDNKQEVPNDSVIFVSSLCWKKNSSTIVAANSEGLIQVLEMK